MASWEKWRSYCKELAEYFIRKYKLTKLNILESASKPRLHILCGGYGIDVGYEIDIPDPRFPYEFTQKQREKLRSFRMDIHFAKSTILEWILLLTFPEFGQNEDFFINFAGDSLFWRLNLEYYKRKQRTIFQDYQLPSFDWDTFHFWRNEHRQMYDRNEINEEIKIEYENTYRLLDEYLKQVMQIAADAVAYLS